MMRTDDELWSEFLSYIPKAPIAGSPLELFEGFEQSLVASGMSAEDARSERLRVLRLSNARRDWIGPMFDRIYTSTSPNFRLAPNAFLTEVVAGVEPGRALDIAMGQGRNAVFLASIGWTTSGIDVSKAGIAAAKENARRAGVKIEAYEVGVDDFDLGSEAWDLIVLTYALVPGGIEAIGAQISAALTPGGYLVIESFGSDPTSTNRRSVDVDPHQLRQLFADLDIFRFEDERTIPEWTDVEARVIRMAARRTG